MRVLCSIAWADLQLTDEEMERIINLVSVLDYVDASEVQELLAIPRRFGELDKVRELDRKLRLRLLHDAYLVASLTGSVGDGELAIVRQIAATIVPEEKWPEVEACLMAYAAYEKRCRDLWGVTHLA